MTACEFCAGAGTVLVAVGPVDPFGVPDGTVEVPCPHCPAGDAEAEHRIGRSWRTPSSPLSSQDLSARSAPTALLDRSDRDGALVAATPVVPGAGVASSSPPQSLLDSTGSRCGDPGTTVESPSRSGADVQRCSFASKGDVVVNHHPATVSTDEDCEWGYMLADEHAPATAGERRALFCELAMKEWDMDLDATTIGGGEEAKPFTWASKDEEELRPTQEGETPESYWFVFTDLAEAVSAAYATADERRKRSA